MKRISKRVREEAAMFCSMIAARDEVDHHWDAPCACAFCVENDAGVSPAASLLARLAFEQTNYDVHNTDAYGMHYAEAESLLRTGWVPK